MRRKLILLLAVICLSGPIQLLACDTSIPLALVPGNGRLAIVADGLPVAVYYYQDPEIPRPYFAHVRVPSGIQVTRNHPPLEGQDPLDHPTYHPGIWLAFGDINGSDYWRLKAPVRHAGFVEEPRVDGNRASFAVRNEYLAEDDSTKTVCEELARYTITVRPQGCLLMWDSSFTGDADFAFGDQEEMGLGVRIATPLCVSAKGNVPKGNGVIRDAEGRRNESQVWGNSAAWCDLSGNVAGQHIGLTLMCHPRNFRNSWFHARDYGFVTANPFGREAFGKGKKSTVVVKPGEKLRLRYGILLYSGQENHQPDLNAAYADYMEMAGL